ncbi:MAG: endonuclease V [Sphingomonas sp.]
MTPDHWLHPPTLKAATIAQREIAEAVETHDRPAASALVGGADTSSRWRDVRGPIHAVIVADGRVGAVSEVPPFPYVPGYLGFREAPALVRAWGMLAERPGLILVDGQGRAHPRRCGVASQLGVVLDVPTIGVAKSLLCGAIEGVVGPAPGDRAAVVDRGETIALALRTRARATPIYVSIGHRVSLDQAAGIVLALTGGRRLPAPIRAAHDAANAVRRAFQADGEGDA